MESERIAEVIANEVRRVLALPYDSMTIARSMIASDLMNLPELRGVAIDQIEESASYLSSYLTEREMRAVINATHAERARKLLEELLR